MKAVVVLYLQSRTNGEQNEKEVKKMKCLIIDFDNSIVVIEDLLFLLHIVDIIWNDNNFVVWYE